MTKTHERISTSVRSKSATILYATCTVMAAGLLGCGSGSDAAHSVERPARRATGGESRPSQAVLLRGDQGGSCAPSAVHFAYDSADLDARARDSLSRDLDCLRRSPHLVVTGMTDPRGTEEYNMALGERRARAVSRYLEAQGLTGVDIHSVGDHMASGRDEGSWAQDRRAELSPRR